MKKEPEEVIEQGVPDMKPVIVSETPYEPELQSPTREEAPVIQVSTAIEEAPTTKVRYNIVTLGMQKEQSAE